MTTPAPQQSMPAPPFAIRLISYPSLPFRMIHTTMFALLTIWMFGLIVREISRHDYLFAALYLSTFALYLWVGVRIVKGTAYLPPRRVKKLCTYGLPTIGRLVKVRNFLGDRIIEYTFTHPVANQSITWTDRVYNKAPLAELKPGDPITVIYNPDNPELSTVYETCGYEIIGEFEVGTTQNRSIT